MSVFDLGSHWHQVNCGMEYRWKVGPSARGRLLEIVPDFDVSLLDRDPSAANQHLRNSLRRHLNGSKRELACHWIAKDWGGIRSGEGEKLSKIIESFGAFTEAEITTAATALGFDRISTWSKLAAFAIPDRFAIYDSRTAAAMSCLLMQNGGERKFFVPPAKGKKENNPVIMFRGRLSAPPSRSLSYADFNRMLLTAVSKERSLLEVEMALFANSKEICSRFFQSQPN